jgi:integrase
MLARPHADFCTKAVAGSFDALAVAYYRSPRYLALTDNSRREVKAHIERVRTEHGDKPVARIERRHILNLIAARIEAGHPAAANRLLMVLRMLMRFAIELEMRRDDPTAGIKRVKIKGDGYHTWTEDEIAQFEKRWPNGSRERLALYLMLFTALRRGDATRLKWTDVVGGVVVVTQGKTGGRLALPVHPALAAELAVASRNAETILATQWGKPFSVNGFYNWFADAAKDAGLPKGCSPHGLRKAACRRLAEAGASASEIMAVSGHKTLAEAERYCRAAGQKHLAERAFAALASAGLASVSDASQMAATGN